MSHVELFECIEYIQDHRFPYKRVYRSKKCSYRNSKPALAASTAVLKLVQGLHLNLLESQQFCCDYMSQYGADGGISFLSLLSSVFYSRAIGVASLVKTAISAAGHVLMIALHQWFI